MFQVITIATASFLRHAGRLRASLLNSGNDCHLTIFCDDGEAFRPFGKPGFCTIRELPEIGTLGVKRAKFTAYDIAARDGAFLYLDADVIVLKPIAEIVAHERIAGCYDDLSSVEGIADQTHPWPGDPDLENRRFINSGVFHVPSVRRDFIRELRARSVDDGAWNRYILPGLIYDNAFLCAQLNILDEPVDYIDETTFNWQGFVVDGRLQVERRGDSLVNVRSGKALAIAHFAGVSDPDAAMCTWPVEVTSLLAARGAAERRTRASALVEFLGSVSDDFDDAPADPLPGQMFNALTRETVDLVTGNLRRDYAARRGYFVDPASMLSLAYSLPYGRYRWNGLACGNAYLDGEEYNFFQRVIQELGIKTAVETGAGETSILMKKFGVDALSLETQPGPWLERAVAEGCRCALVGFDRETAQFDSEALRAELEPFAARACDLVLIDSPVGTYARSRVMDQVVSAVQPKYVLMHDALRDARNVFNCQQRFGMTLAAFLPSERGFALLASGRADSSLHRSLTAFEPGVSVAAPRVRIELAGSAIRSSETDERFLSLRVTNLGHETLSSRYANPVHVSYHWLSHDSNMLVWDGLRTALPFDILPGGAADLEASVTMLEGAFDARLCLTLVQEDVAWFDVIDGENRLIVRVAGSESGSVAITPDR
jgi:hypothetical protein